MQLVLVTQWIYIEIKIYCKYTIFQYTGDIIVHNDSLFKKTIVKNKDRQ